MAFLNDLLKIGGTVAQFVPGGQAIGAGLGALGGVLDASEAAKAKNKAIAKISAGADNTADLGGLYQSLVQKNLPGLFQGAFDSFNTPISDQVDAPYRSIIEGSGTTADNAVNQLIQDYASRGLLRDSSGLSAAIGGVRSAQAAQGSRTMSDLITQALARRQQGLLSLGGLLQGFGGQALSANNQALGTMGGLEGIYASESNGLGKALGDLAGVAGKIGARPKTAGQATLNTNNAPTPLGGPTAPTFTYQRDPIPQALPPARKSSAMIGGF